MGSQRLKTSPDRAAASRPQTSSEVPAAWPVVLPFLFHWWPRSLRNPSQAKVSELLQYGLINTNKRSKQLEQKLRAKTVREHSHLIRAEKGYATSLQFVKSGMLCSSARISGLKHTKSAKPCQGLIINVWKAGPPMEPNPAKVARPKTR